MRTAFSSCIAGTRDVIDDERSDRTRADTNYAFKMNIKYFQDTDTLYIEFRKGDIAETRDLDENTLLDIDASGNIVAMTIEHARQRADIPHFSFEQVAA